MHVRICFSLWLYLIFFKTVFKQFTNAKPFVGHNISPALQINYKFIAAITRCFHPIKPEKHVICTASVISKKDILTAAHCVEEQKLHKVQVITGNIDLNARTISYPSWWLTHDQWARTANITIEQEDNDIAIIRLTRNVADGIPAASLSYIPQSQLSNVFVIGAGWGEINNGSFPNILHAASLRILIPGECEVKVNRLDSQDGVERNLVLPPNYWCTIGDPFAVLMRGDSGGPLMYRGQIIGINKGTCPFPAQSFHPDKINLHLNLFHYNQFINECMNM